MAKIPEDDGNYSEVAKEFATFLAEGLNRFAAKHKGLPTEDVLDGFALVVATVIAAHPDDASRRSAFNSFGWCLFSNIHQMVEQGSEGSSLIH